MQDLLSQVLLQVKVRDSSLVLMTPGPALLPGIGGQGKGEGGHWHFSLNRVHMTDKWWGQLSHVHILGSSSPVPPPGPVLM